MKKFFAALTLLILINSCVETVVVGSVAGATVVAREKSLKNTKDDVIIAAKIDAELLKNGAKTPQNSVNVMVNEGRVLLTGIVRDVEMGKKAVIIVNKVAGVKEVIDEIQIDRQGFGVADFGDFFRDSYITSAIKTKLFFKPSIASANYKISTIAGTVYLFGIAIDEENLKEVAATSSKTIGVRKVVNHIILANDARRR